MLQLDVSMMRYMLSITELSFISGGGSTGWDNNIMRVRGWKIGLWSVASFIGQTNQPLWGHDYIDDDKCLCVVS